jgi:single-strand DNA-binding protein
MSFNNKVQLSGFLGQDPKPIIKGNKSFTVLRLATTDSYPVKQGDQTVWKDKETEWHDVFVFRPSASKFSNELKKGDKVEISGSISYQPFKDQEGNNRRQATIIASFVERPNDSVIEKVITDELVKDLASSLAP